MAPKDKSTPSLSKAEKQLTAQVKALRTRVKTLEAEADTWRKRAEKQTSKLQKVKDQAEKAIADATALAKKRARAKAEKKIQQVIADHQRDDRPRAEPLALKDAPALPEASWTVAQLRVAAREQGVPGYSRLRKDQLLAALL
ncbi:MAG: Rho termination factor N-terminal domain-containing protein [Aeromicrobium sp.]